MSCDIESELDFLVRAPTYDTVKPYACRFIPPESFPSHNLEIEKKGVTIRDARLLNPSLDEHGFTLTSYPTKMRYSDYSALNKIERVYAPELQAHLKDLLQAQHVKIIDSLVCAPFFIICGFKINLKNRFGDATLTFQLQQGSSTRASSLL